MGSNAILVHGPVQKSLVPEEISHVQNLLHIVRILLPAAHRRTRARRRRRRPRRRFCALLCNGLFAVASDDEVYRTPRETLGNDLLPSTERSGLHPLQHMDNERRVVAV